MVNVAIVEDEDAAAAILSNCLDKYASAKREGVEFSVCRYHDAVSFLENYRSRFDIVFMDIQLPDLDGMEAAKKLRRLDSSVTLIFVTNMANFAVRGYEVDALDFIVKPVEYFSFALKLDRALERLKSTAEQEIFAKT